MFCDGLVGLLIEQSLFLRERADLPCQFLALPSKLLCLRVIAVALLLERRRRDLPCREDECGERCAYYFLHPIIHAATPSKNA